MDFLKKKMFGGKGLKTKKVKSLILRKNLFAGKGLKSFKKSKTPSENGLFKEKHCWGGRG